MKPIGTSKAFLLLALLVICSLFASCVPAAAPAPTSPPADVPTTAPAAPAATEPQMGGTLHLGFEGTYEHDLWSWLAEMWHPDGMSHNALIRVKNDLSELVPELATRWEASDDSKTYTFYLREDVKWHDGMPFTADDVVFTYNALCHIKTGTQYCAQFFGNIEGLKEYRDGLTDAISGVKKLDDYTVQLTFNGPHPINLWWVGYLYIHPKHILGDVPPDQLRANDYWRTSRIGTGPFKFESYTPKQSIIYVRNDDFWGQKPYIERAIWHIYDKTETALLALEKGEIDTWAGYAAIPIPEIPRFEAMPNVQVMPGPSGVTNYIMVNQAHPQFTWGAKKEFRQALMQCIDKKTLIDTMWSGKYAEDLPVSVLQERYLKPDIKRYTYDPEAAKVLLDAINYDYNFEVELVWYYSGQFWEDMGAAMQAQAAKCGIKLKPKFVDSPTWSKLTSGYRTAEGYMLGIAGHGIPLFPDDHFVLFTKPLEEGGRNVFGWRNQEFEDLVAAAATATNEEERTKLYYQLQDIMADELPELPLWIPHRPPGVNIRVQNSLWGPNYFGYFQNFQNWWLKQ